MCWAQWAWSPEILNSLEMKAGNSCSVCLCTLKGRGMIRKQVVCWVGWSACDAAASPLEKYVQGMAGMWSLSGSAGALPGPASSPPTSAMGLLHSPEQVTYLFPVSFPASRGLDPVGSGRNSAVAQLCNSTEIKSLRWTSTPFSAPVGWGREEITQTFLFTP